MQEFFNISILFGFLFLVGKFVVWPFKSITQDTPKKVKVASKHGHRCYIEGLNPSEKMVVDLLSENLNCKDYFIFNNIILPSSNGGSTQIDHIIVSRFGIFVIESKDYSGWIFAHKNRKQWTVTYRYAQKYHFQNPLLQNYGHVATLQDLMPYVSKNIFNIVVFSDFCEFKTPRIENVCYLSELIEYINNFKEVKLKEVELLIVIGKLSYMCQTVDITPETHVKNIRQFTKNM